MMSTQIHARKHDVFLSFRGDDVRHNFVSHLHAALCRNGIETFIDDELRRGEEISDALLKAIEESSVSIIVFSEKYAESKWCLDELVKILECRRVHGQIVMPIFYHVDPSTVRKQTGSYAKAFTKHKQLIKVQKDKIQRWKNALNESANLSGWDSRDWSEAKLINQITSEILVKLNNSSSADIDGVFGIQTRVKRVESSLCVGLADVRMLGIWGMGGIGKTTIARTLFDKISAQFEACCFLEDVREDCMRNGLPQLQKKLFAAVLVGKETIEHFSTGFFKDRLRRKKVLIVLDDVDEMKQLEKLAGEHNWLGAGSRIIITTRNKQLLTGVDDVYEVENLIFEEAMQLFCHHAFKKSCHPREGYLELSKKAVFYAGGNPLALKVLGSHLFGKDKNIWMSELGKLEKFPMQAIQVVLRISFDSLDDTEKEILLDVACFFKRKAVDFVREILDGCGYFPDSGIDVLIDKSLLYITIDRLSMHDLIEEMSKEIVRQENTKEPGKRSRLWYHEDIFHIFKKNSGTEAVETISLDLSKIKQMELSEEAFVKMPRLRLLKLFSTSGNFADKKKIRLPRGLTMIPDDLRYIYWDGYPYCKFFGPNLDRENKLVGLDLRHSCIKQLWEEQRMEFKYLKWIDLSHSKCLSQVPDLSGAQNLEKIVLKGCTKMSTIHPSINSLSNLISLDLTDCYNLQSLPNNVKCKSLRTLILSGCSKLQNFPTFSTSMEQLSTLSLDGTAISNVPPSIENLIGLRNLTLEYCKNLVSLSDGVCKLKHLQKFNLFGCESLKYLPKNIGNLESLEEFDIKGTSIEVTPHSFSFLKNIKSLSLGGIDRSSESSIGLQLPPLQGFQQLRKLYLAYCNLVELPSGVDGLSSLGVLNLHGNNFESLPQGVCNLRRLNILYVSNCKRLQSLPKLPSSLISLHACECTSLESISSVENLFYKLRTLRLDFYGCFKLDKKIRYSIILKAIIARVQVLAKLWHHEKGAWAYETTGCQVIFPGSEIPKWFVDTEIGSSITRRIPLDCLKDYKLVGIAMCVVLPLGEYDWSFSIRVFYDFKLTIKGYGEFTWPPYDPPFDPEPFFILRPLQDMIKLEDHVAFEFVTANVELEDWLNNLNDVGSNLNGEASITFWVDYKPPDGGVQIDEVKECGFRLVYVEG